MGVDASRRRVVPPGSLFERLRADDEHIALEEGGSVAGRITSIKSNLVNILNTRAGSSASALTLGLGDFNDSAMESSNMLAMVAQDIRRCIQDHEPRVSDVEVAFERHDNRGTQLHFVIRANTRVGRRNDVVTVDLALLDGRHFRLR